MMSSHLAITRTAYREDDIRFPVFNYPVLLAARVLRYANDCGGFRNVSDALLVEAAEVADLVARLSEPVDYIDFSVNDGFQSLQLRMTVVERRGAAAVCIDFRHAPVRYCNRPADIEGLKRSASSMTR